ncbi:MAG: hypothetical protein E6G76_05655 [Alphaproteobacteria bacterium]|nr:MAG: hypothetical protein E6G76_05655 [Alphaproteobacteria bacterium]
MPNPALSPLSSAVSSVFDQFLKKLETEKILDKSAREALAQSFQGQKLDHESLRKALFKRDELQQ